jgi:hypothetical protein
MPVDDSPSSEQTQKILSSATNVKRFKNMKKSTDGLLEDINTIYGKALNKLVFDSNLTQTDSTDKVNHKELFGLVGFEIPLPKPIIWKR